MVIMKDLKSMRHEKATFESDSLRKGEILSDCLIPILDCRMGDVTGLGEFLRLRLRQIDKLRIDH